MPSTKVAPAGTLGFDTNTPLDAEGAVAFYEHGYRFAVRYVRRVLARANDLSVAEIQRLHDAGLAVSVVQHVESETSWVPSVDKGAEYGANAAAATGLLGIPQGVVVWCDLEGVARGTPAATTLAHCNAWFEAVAGQGYVPGIYVGWHCGLTPDQLYRGLKFAHFWGAYNLNSDEEPAIRGLQMKQHAALHKDVPAGLPYSIDVDTVRADNLGGLPIVYAPDGWLT
ncbi:MAG TPA: glycoside hydrolase domain-containing protein [Gemmatimonadaceae bacterium]|jgi:hypothetical protein|nr:glycoside hydrolase domain-containing protein [Gemmatimonadaceae bacterium]